jgi:hypothetical protein
MNKSNLEAMSAIAQTIFDGDYLWFVEDSNSVGTTLEKEFHAVVSIDEDVLLVSMAPPVERYNNQWREQEFDMRDPESIQDAQEEIYWWLDEAGLL